MRIGLGCGLGFGSMMAADVPFYPTQVPGCLAFWDLMAPSSLVYGTTLRATGGGPAVTCTVQPTISTAFKIEIQTATTFRWSNDGGATWAASGVTIPNGSTIDLGSAGTYAFAAGVYSAAHSYEITLQDWLSLVNPTHKWSQATAASQPRLVAGPTGTTATIAARADGVDDQMVMTTLSLPGPGVTPTWYFAIFRLDAYSSNDQLIGSDAARVAVAAGAASNTIRQSSGANANEIAVTLGAFGRTEAYFSNTTSDYVKWRTTSSTGASAGGTAPANANLYLFARNATATTFMSGSLCALGVWNQNPSAGNKALLDAWVTGYGGAGLV